MQGKRFFFSQVLVLLCYSGIKMAESQITCPGATTPAPPTSEPSNETFSVLAYWFVPGNGACGNYTGDTTFLGAINNERWDNPALSSNSVWCGRCIEVDAPDYNTTVIVQIVEHAGGSAILVSRSAFESLVPAAVLEANPTLGEVNVEYHLVDCPSAA